MKDALYARITWLILSPLGLGDGGVLFLAPTQQNEAIEAKCFGPALLIRVISQVCNHCGYIRAWLEDSGILV